MEKEVLIKAEEKQLRFLIRDFVELQKLLQTVKDTEENIPHQQAKVIKNEIDKILKQMRSGLFSGEERIEYKMARHYQRLVEIIVRVSAELDYSEHHTISEILQKAHVYNAELEKLGSRGGEIEQSLEQAKKYPPNQENLQKTKMLIERALQADRAFEAVMEELVSESKKIKVLKSEMYVSEQKEKLAIVDTLTEKSSLALVLYDKEKLDSIYHDFSELINSKDWGAMEEYEKEITAQVFDSHFEKKEKIKLCGR